MGLQISVACVAGARKGMGPIFPSPIPFLAPATQAKISAVTLFLNSSEKNASTVDNVIGLCIYTKRPTCIVVTQG